MESEGVRLIAEERRRQVEVEGWSTAHDDDHSDGALALAGACYALPPEKVHVPRIANSVRGMEDAGYVYHYTRPGPGQVIWPWEPKHYKRTPVDRIRELVKAGALIAAEIDRLHRAAALDAEREEEGDSA